MGDSELKYARASLLAWRLCQTIPVMVPDRIVSPEEKALTDEMAELAKQQSEALQTAVYMRMPADTAAEYDKRAKRIGEICALLTVIRK